MGWIFSFPKVLSHPQLSLPLETCFRVTLGKALNSYPIPACKNRKVVLYFFFLQVMHTKEMLSIFRTA